MAAVEYQQQDARPVYVEFETRSVEDRNATIQEGHYVGRDVDFAIITTSGTNTVEKEAEVWLKSKETLRDPFARHYRETYLAFQEGQEAPIEGTSIKDWAALSPSQVKMLLSVGVRAVEDLATAPEPVLRKMGMGAHALQTKAQVWLQSANDHGKVAEQVADLTAKVSDLASTVEEKDRQIAALMARLDGATPQPVPDPEPGDSLKPKRGRPRKA